MQTPYQGMMTKGKFGEESSALKAVRIVLVFLGGGILVLAMFHLSYQRNLESLRENAHAHAGDDFVSSMTTAAARSGSQLLITEPALCAKAPYVLLGQPTADSINLRLLSDYPSTIIIEWGDGNAATQKTTPLKLTPSQPSTLLPLRNLKMSTRYAYRVLFQNNEACDGYYTTESFFFHTQRLFGEEFTFAVTADTHFNDENIFDQETFIQTRANMIKAAHSLPGYDFLIDLGDTFMGLKLKPTTGAEHLLYENAFKELSPVARSAPIFLVNGNHDGESGEFLPKSLEGATLKEIEASLPVTYARLRNAYFANPGSGGIYSSSPESTSSIGQLTNFYAWMWGNSLFVALDPYWYTTTIINRSPWQWTLGKTQYDWLNSVLISPASLKFIFIHHYVGGLYGTSMGFHGGGDESFAKYFEWGGYDPIHENYAFVENRPGWDYGPVHQICVNNHVSIVFRGHDHLYHVGELDGVLYNTLPRTSEATHKTVDLKERWAEKGYADNVIATSGHVEVTANMLGATVSLHAYTASTVLHQYNVAASA